MSARTGTDVLYIDNQGISELLKISDLQQRTSLQDLSQLRYNMLLRYFVLLLAISLLLPGCEKEDEPAAVDIVAEKEAVGDVLVAYISSVENENMADYAHNICHDPEMVNFGAFGEPIRG
jgi:hypothetical protein